MSFQEFKKSRGRPKRDLKADIAAKAVELFLERGFHQTRIEDIVLAMNMGKGTFYLNFKNKEEIVSYIIEKMAKDITDTLSWVKDNAQEEESLIDVFQSESLKLVKILKEHESESKFLFRQGRAISEQIQKQINQYYLNIVEQAESTYEMGMNMGFLAKGNARISAMCVLGGILQVLHHYLERELKEKPEVMAKEMTIFFSRALGLKV